MQIRSQEGGSDKVGELEAGELLPCEEAEIVIDCAGRGVCGGVLDDGVQEAAPAQCGRRRCVGLSTPCLGRCVTTSASTD